MITNFVVEAKYIAQYDYYKIDCRWEGTTFSGFSCLFVAEAFEASVSWKLIVKNEAYKSLQYDAETKAMFDRVINSIKAKSIHEAVDEINSIGIQNVYVSNFKSEPAGWQNVGYTADDVKQVALYAQSASFTFDAPSKETLKVMHGFDKPVECTGIHQEIEDYTFNFKPSPENELSELARQLPGVHEETKYPCTCSRGQTSSLDTIFAIIIHLNDKCGWSREQVADWLDEINDPTGENGPDLTFKLPKETTND